MWGTTRTSLIWSKISKTGNIRWVRWVRWERHLPKPGGLDVETNRDRDRERPLCRD